MKKYLWLSRRPLTIIAILIITATLMVPAVLSATEKKEKPSFYVK